MSTMERIQAAVFLAVFCDVDEVWQQMSQMLADGYSPTQFDGSLLVGQSRAAARINS